MTRRETMVRLALLPDGRVELQDWRGRISTCTVSELGPRCRAILESDDLPQVEVLSEGYWSLVPAEYQQIAHTGVAAFEALMALFQQTRPAAPRPSSTAQRPSPKNTPNSHHNPAAGQPRGRVHRRGQRVA